MGDIDSEPIALFLDLVPVLTPLVELVVQTLRLCELASILGDAIRTLGRLTLGTMTTFKALGAFLAGLDLSPPGWYWYFESALPSSTCHGMEPSRIETLDSEEAEVGLRPA